ncbi:MAG: hypothetical protein ACD_4C00392G0001 [uncultured bacterium (gcode 4)]|uniref:J domain-containing protein n=1 Tax=uncultured bacterium (gcode 4) TaxID=1234023 RepID=K2FTI5_9BACT|nr:MAG: hypothetical protein ACD_4C00392G0001 [uncultured bacterium (gcode 4)]
MELGAIHIKIFTFDNPSSSTQYKTSSYSDPFSVSFFGLRSFPFCSFSDAEYPFFEDSGFFESERCYSPISRREMDYTLNLIDMLFGQIFYSQIFDLGNMNYTDDTQFKNLKMPYVKSETFHEPENPYTQPKQPETKQTQSTNFKPEESVKSSLDEHYAVLGLKKESTESEIKSAYKKLALKHHPDKNLNNQKQAEEMFKKIKNAYELIMNDRGFAG